MRYLIINDQHFYPNRQGGTTPDSRAALDDWMMEQFKGTLNIPHDELIIAGDLSNKRNIPEHIMEQIILLLRYENAYIVLGNHCLQGKFDTTLSSCEFIGRMADAAVIKKPSTILGTNIHVIPHLFNQEEFDIAVDEVPEDFFLITHCNIDSPFAVGNHSLNLSLKQIKELKKKNVKVLAAHEHHARLYKGVEVIGNQFPSSIVDCLGGDKYAVVIDTDTEEVTNYVTWTCNEDYVELDYTELHKPLKKFTRINGECELVEYPAIVREIAQLRKSSDCFILANNVKVKTIDQSISQEEVTGFNILELLLENIDEEFKEEVKTCI